MRPIQPEANLLPRWGVEINIDPLNVRPMIEDKRLLEKFACVARQRCLGRRRGKKIAPDFVAGVRDH